MITLIVSSVSFSQKHKRIDLVNFVKEAVVFARAQGFEKACTEFNDGKKFKRGEFYIFAYDFEGKVLCHGATKELIGKNLLEMKDRKGNKLIKGLIKAAQSDGAFVKYVWPLPNSEVLADKVGYALPVDKKYWLGSGIYFKDN